MIPSSGLLWQLLHDFLVDLLIAMMNLKPPVFKNVNKCCLLYVSSSVMLSTILHQGHIGLVGHGWYLWGDKVWDCCIATTLPNLTRSGAISYHLMSYIPHAPPRSVTEAFSFLGHLLKVLGVKESEDKSCAPSTEMSFLGILFNSVKMTMEVEPDRLHKLLLLLPTWLHKSHATRKEVESLIGLLSFVAKCVRPARIFLSRMLDFMKGLPKSGRFSIPTEFMLDVRWWYRFVAQYNGVSIIPPSHWSAVNSVIETDACLSGGGGVNFETRECFQFEFPSELRNNTQASINEYELLTIMVAVKVWGSSLRGKKVRVNCDNTTAVAAMNLARLHNKFSQAIMREISYWSAVGEFEVMTMHISGLRNIVADTLSRTHLSVQSRIKMESLVRELGLKVVVVPNEAFEFTGQWVWIEIVCFSMYCILYIC